jgi:hypothetical protein
LTGSAAGSVSAYHISRRCLRSFAAGVPVIGNGTLMQACAIVAAGVSPR